MERPDFDAIEAAIPEWQDKPFGEEQRCDLLDVIAYAKHLESLGTPKLVEIPGAGWKKEPDYEGFITQSGRAGEPRPEGSQPIYRIADEKGA